MRELYSERERNNLRGRCAALLALLAVAALTALVLCILCISQIKTGNVWNMAIRAVTVSTLAGWAELFLIRNLLRPLGREYRHCGMILSEPAEETAEGTLTLEKEILRIPASIRIRRAVLSSESGQRRVSVNARKAKSLPTDGTAVRLRLRNGYIVGWEAIE